VEKRIVIRKEKMDLMVILNFEFGKGEGGYLFLNEKN